MKPALLPFCVFLISVTAVENTVVNVSINFTHPIQEVNKRFLSVAFGAGMMVQNKYSLREVLRSEKLLTLASALAPAYLRLGGTAADFVTFDPESKSVPDDRDLEDSDKRVEEGVYHYKEEEEETRKYQFHNRVLSERELEMRSKLTAYWYRCGCEDESPQMSVYIRDRLKVAKREQLGEGFWDDDEDDDDVVELKDLVDDTFDGQIMTKKKLLGRRIAKKPHQNITMTGQDWDEINTFVRKTGLRLLFDVNALKTTPWGEWNSSNAETLLRYSAERNYSMDLQMGNEPNHYPHHVQRSVSPEQMARNFWLLRRLLQSGIGGVGMKDALLVGPDVTRPKTKRDSEYLRDFLKDAINAIDAITWHQYYVNGRTATIDQFTDPKTFNVLREYIDRILAVRSETGPSKAIWMTETASAYGGGACGLSDRFVDGFFWLDKLGTAAAMGVDVVTRQTLWKGQYGLLEGDLSFEPRPDYWLTLLFKRLVGERVLKVLHDGDAESGLGENAGRIRLYAHCASGGKSAVTLFGMNMMEEAVVLRLKDVFPLENQIRRPQLWKVVVNNYILQSNHERLYSTLVRLNGRTLHMHREDALPVLKPVVEKFREPHQVALKMPGLAMALYVIEGLEAKACSG